MSRPLHLVATLALVACTTPRPSAPERSALADPLPALRRFAADPAVRRETLRASLVRADNAYARRRLEHYEDGSHDRPVALPSVIATRAARRAFDDGRDPDGDPIAWPDSLPEDPRGVGELGARAFSNYPLAIEPAFDNLVGDDAALARVGIALDRDGTAVGLVLVREGDEWHAAYSCALCHAHIEDGAVRPGIANRALRFGDVLAQTFLDAPDLERWRRWGPGRVDVTDDGADDPLLIPDLTDLASERYLQRSGEVAVTSPASIAVRVHTLLDESARDGAPVPASIAAAITAYLLRDVGVDRGPMPRGAGREIFERRCSSCHEGDAAGGARLVPASVVGTDANAATSPDRGTGMYRVPVLRGCGARGRWFHDGSIARLEDVLGRERFDAAFVGPLGRGAVPGHAWGTELDAHDRSELLAYLRTL